MSEEKQLITSIRQIIGCQVQNKNGEPIGKLEDLFFDMEHLQIMYAILSIGNFFGLEKKHFAFPSDTLFWKTEDKPFLIINLDLDRDLLMRVPGIEDTSLATEGIKSVDAYLDRVRWMY